MQAIKSTTKLSDSMPAPSHELREKYRSKAEPVPEKEVSKAMKKAGYNTEFIIAELKRKRLVDKQESQGSPVANVKTSRRAPRKNRPKRVLHAKYMHTKSQSEALEEL